MESYSSHPHTTIKPTNQTPLPLILTPPGLPPGITTGTTTIVIQTFKRLTIGEHKSLLIVGLFGRHTLPSCILILPTRPI